MSMQRVSEMVYSQILAAMATDGLIYIVILYFRKTVQS